MMGDYPYSDLSELYLDLESLRERVAKTLRSTDPTRQFPYQHTLIEVDKLIHWLGVRTD